MKTKTEKTSINGAKGKVGFASCLAMASVGALIGCIATAPASLLARFVDSTTDGRVQLLNASGSVWNGKANLVLTGGQLSNSKSAFPTPINWKLKPSFGAFEFQLKSKCCTTDNGINGRITPSKIEFDNTTFTFPLSVLSGLGAPFNTVSVRGSMQLRSMGFSLSWNQGMSVSGEVNGVASNVSTPLTTLATLGTYQFVLSQKNKTPELEFKTVKGDLRVEGLGRVEGGKFSFSGVAESLPESQAALANFLALLGQRHGNKTKIRFG